MIAVLKFNLGGVGR
ncbi:hypothetical protein [Caulobacter sp. RL271]